VLSTAKNTLITSDTIFIALIPLFDRKPPDEQPRDAPICPQR